MVTLFYDMIYHEIEVYVDDMIAKSHTTQDHLVEEGEELKEVKIKIWQKRVKNQKK
jgi:hypothetical protein